MKELFEKIVEILENKAREDEKDMQLSDSYEDAQAFGGKKEGYENAIEIVNRAAAEYNNGWISCSERFPKVEDLHEKSIDNCTCYLIQRRCGIMDVAHYIKVYGEPYFEANSIKMKDVVAWHPLPEPYHPNTCQDTECPYNDGKDCPAADGCAGYERKQTNADRIRSMSDEELAMNMMGPNENGLGEIECDKSDNRNCYECLLKWLQSEAEQ